MGKKKLPISVFMITQDEETRLPRTLTAICDLVDDIVIVDSGSTDNTVDIAQDFEARVFHRQWTGYGPQKRFAESQCRHDWVYNLDADEVVSDALAQELRQIFDPLPDPAAYRGRILTIYPGDDRPRPFANDYNIIRLYHRSIGQFSDHPIHDRPVIADGATVHQLEHPIWHYSIESWDQLIDKLNRYTTRQAAASNKQADWRLKARLGVERWYNFWKIYLGRRHVFGGWKGFTYAQIIAQSRADRLAKIIERSEKNSDPAS
jgi:glycosyltransferase involved in cell wall biosynthesis